SVELESEPVLWNAGRIALASFVEPSLTERTYVQEYAASCAYCRALKEGFGFANCPSFYGIVNTVASTWMLCTWEILNSEV
ncbi:hypothetical protein NEUTE1DRAFT_48924, partial [Neurospora tetrasperma FGSC 2508]